MSILDKLRLAKKKPVEAQPSISEKDLHKKLKEFLYSDDLVQEYADTFRSLYENPEFSKVMELIEAKEQELNSVNGSQEMFEQTSEPNNEPTLENETKEGNEDYLMTILKDRYGE